MTYKLCSLQDDLFQVLCSRHKDLIRSHVVSQHYKLGDGLDILSKIYRGLMIKSNPMPMECLILMLDVSLILTHF